MMHTALAFLPIFLLLVLSFVWGVRQAIFVAFAVTAGLFFLGRGQVPVWGERVGWVLYDFA